MEYWLPHQPSEGDCIFLLQPPSEDESEEAWAPVWKAVEESPQVKYGIISRFMEKLEFETYDDQVDDSELPPIQIGTTVSKGRDSYDRLKRFLKQVRESRGYDVDVCPYDILGRLGPYMPIAGEEVKKCKNEFERAITKINFVLDEINNQAQMHGKSYEYHDIERVVGHMQSRSSLITFIVKEANTNVFKTVQATVFTIGFPNFKLLEWRFKPKQLPQPTS